MARGHGERCRRAPLTMTAIYAEPAPADQLQLVSLLYRRPVRVAAIVGPDTGFLQAGAGAAGAELYDFATRRRHQPRAEPHRRRPQVLLAMPDSAVYTPENFRNILLSTYRHNQGVIGFSADMVKAGALASTYSDIEDINAQVAEMAADFVATGELRAAAVPALLPHHHQRRRGALAKSPSSDEARSFARRPRGRPR